MTRYSSANEAMAVLKNTIRSGLGTYSTNPRDYYMNRVFDALFHYDPNYGWGLVHEDEAEMMKILRMHMRESGRIVWEVNERDKAVAATEDMPWSDAKCRAIYGYGIETYMSM